MATIIDEFVVEFGLDPSKFTAGQKTVTDSMKKLEETVDKHGKNVAKSTKEMGEGFSSIVKLLGEMTAGYLAASGITSFIASTNQANLAVGQLATTLGLAPERLERYRVAAQRANLDPASMNATLSNVYKSLYSGPGGSVNPTAWVAAAQLGMDPSVLQRAHNLRDPTIALQGAAEAVRNNPRGLLPGQQQEFLGQLGISQSQILMIMEARGNLQKFFSELKTLTDDQVRGSTELSTAYNKLTTDTEGVRQALVSNLMKPFTNILKVLDELFGWILKTDWAFNALVKTLEIIVKTILGGAMGAVIGAVLGIPGGVPGMLAGAAMGGIAGATAGAGQGVIDAIREPHVSPSGTFAPGAETGAGGPSGGFSTLKEDRARFISELNANPALKDEFFRRSLGEDDVGSAPGTLANQAIMETAMNRASVRGTSLAGKGNLGYFAGRFNGTIDAKRRAILEQNLAKVANGSDVTKGAIDNSSSWLAAKHLRTGEFIDNAVIHGEHFEIPGTHQSRTGDREGQKAWYGRMKQGAEPAPSTPSPAESWGQWLNRATGWNGKQSSIDNSRRAEMRTGDINIYNPQDATHVVRNLEPLMRNRFSAVAADNGYS
jgi:hypothetical protein